MVVLKLVYTVFCETVEKIW